MRKKGCRGSGRVRHPHRRPPSVNGVPQPYLPGRPRLTGSPTRKPWPGRRGPRPVGHVPPGGKSRHERDRPPQQRPQCRLAAPQPPGQQQGRPDVGGGGVRCRCVRRLDHPHAVHDHRGVVGLGDVEGKVQPALGGRSPRADGDQRPLAATQPNRSAQPTADVTPIRRRSRPMSAEPPTTAPPHTAGDAGAPKKGPASAAAPSALRTLVLRLHFYAGVFVAPFLLVAAVTGWCPASRWSPSSATTSRCSGSRSPASSRWTVRGWVARRRTGHAHA